MQEQSEHRGCEDELQIARENEWVRVWNTDAGVYVDSKYRTYECDASADQFLAAWLTVNEQERKDLELAYEFFPYRSGARRVARVICTILGEEYAGELERSWFGESGELRAVTLDFLREALICGVGIPTKVCETDWFDAYWDGFSYSFKQNGKNLVAPSYKDFCAEYVKATSRLQIDILTKFWGIPRDT